MFEAEKSRTRLDQYKVILLIYLTVPVKKKETESNANEFESDVCIRCNYLPGLFIEVNQLYCRLYFSKLLSRFVLAYLETARNPFNV